ncbi:MAG: ABC transporter permease [Bacteroidetes bacterium]|nr:ABC transporter permease [Bacteroidota bacterium]
MHNILLILKQEYLTRVSKKSFIIMTLLGPLLIAAFYGAIAFIAVSELSNNEKLSIAINDKHDVLNHKIDTSKSMSFEFVDDIKAAKQKIETEDLSALLIIENAKGDSISTVSKKSLSFNEKNQLREVLFNQIFNSRLKNSGISKGSIDSMKVDIVFNSSSLSGKNSATETKSIVGYIGAFLIYLFIFMYGVMIMRGVTEEKNSRIIELIISAVKPFELMMGKILGVALVGLTQFIAWIFLTGILLTVIAILFGLQHADASTIASVKAIPQSGALAIMSNFTAQLQSLDFVKIIAGFVIFFFGGFLLYSALFAAIGSAVDSDTETQQFMFPVSMPLIFGLFIAQMAVINNPNSTLAIWASMIPFTSPVVMMVRIPFDVSWTQILMSAVILFCTFIIIVWVAAKIYRIGILSYGQKASYKQIWKWLRMKE